MLSWIDNPWAASLIAQSPLDAATFLQGAGSRMIRLLVGPEMKEFNVPEGHLRTIDFFDAILEDTFRLPEEGLVRLPEDDPAVVEAFLLWLLRDSKDWSTITFSPQLDERYVTRSQHHAIALILFADKIRLLSLLEFSLGLL